MKHKLLARLLIYAALLALLFSVFGSPEAAPRGANIGFYIGYYGIIILPLILIEAVYQVVSLIRRFTAAPVRVTQPLPPPPDALPTRPIDPLKPPF